VQRELENVRTGRGGAKESTSVLNVCVFVCLKECVRSIDSIDFDT
jgi:hypothetical protein